MDFTKLVIAPLATIITFSVVFASALIRRGSEDRALLSAFVGARPPGWSGASALGIFEQKGVSRRDGSSVYLRHHRFLSWRYVSLIIVKSVRFLRSRFVRER